MTRTTATINGITYSGTECSHCQVRYIDCIEHWRKTKNPCCDECARTSTHDLARIVADDRALDPQRSMTVTIEAEALDSIVLSTENCSSYVHVWCDKCEVYIESWIKEKPLSYVIELITEHGCGPLGDS